jgi:lipoprotein-anchoring transpeptidase ErfK/SrfK
VADLVKNGKKYCPNCSPVSAASEIWETERRRKMVGYRALFVCLAISATTFASGAMAQNCERFAWQCQGYSGPSGQPSAPSSFFGSGSSQQSTANYGAQGGEPFPVTAVSLSNIDSSFLRQSVFYPSGEAPGTVVIDTHNHFLYFVLGNNQAIRYGVGVGREGFGWSGIATIHDKREWPDWYPPKEMIARQPEIRRQMSELQSGLGMHGGPHNPLGARAMYLWQGNKDTLFRIHGTVEPWTIGTNVSSGCIRMINQDAIDLYQRVSTGTKVVVQ